MASIPGAAFNITGTTGSQGTLTPKSGWRAYVFPRGGYAAQDSTGTLITFDSSAVASRFAANNWIQAGLATANIRMVAAVGGNSLSVSGAALTITENDRIFVIGNTEPTVSGGSATYGTPATLIRQRDDDGADLYTNSMITSNSDGLVQFFAAPNFYDVLIQDGNRTNQGSIVDLALGAVDGISTSRDALFGASVTVNGAFGVTGWATFGATVTMNAALGVTGWATFGSTVTMNAALGVTGVATFSGRVAAGNSVSIDGALGVTGLVTATSASFSNVVTGVSANFDGDIKARRLILNHGTTSISAFFTLGASWGTGAFLSVGTGSKDTHGQILITAGTTVGVNPGFSFTFSDGVFGATYPYAILTRTDLAAPAGAYWAPDMLRNIMNVTFVGTPVTGSQYGCNWFIVGS